MDTILQKYLTDLRAKVGQMGGLVEESLALSVKALAAKDPSLFPKVFANEDRINQCHKDIDYAVFKLLARQAPVASDLRLILSVSKISIDLERMGDLTKSMAYCVRDYFEGPPILLAKEIPKMADLVRGMVAQSIDAFLSDNETLAREVLKIDDGVDTFRDALCKRLREYLKANPNSVDSGLQLYTVVRNLERVGDHSTNIAEDVIFGLTGEDIRHSQSDKDNGEAVWTNL